MSETFTIATLPVNTDYVQSPTKYLDLIITDNLLIKIASYNDKSFVIFGEATRSYITQIKNLGGKYNGKLKEKPEFPGGAAWIFPTKMKTIVIEFINSVNTGITVTPHILSEGNGLSGLPTVIGPIRTNLYQYVKWKVFKPSVGMSVSIKANGKETLGIISDIETHKDIVDVAYVTIEKGKKTMLMICSGQWKVFGYTIDHTVFFITKPKTDKTMDDVVNI